MRKTIFIILVVLFGVAVLSGCGSQKSIEGYDCGCSIEKPAENEKTQHAV
ncbi:MAG: hypothetical protein ACQESX_09865 [Bacteroidota bacterium]